MTANCPHPVIVSLLQQRFRKNPGCRERHLRRKLDNPLFEPAERTATVEMLDTEQRRDDEELNAFLAAVKELVARVSSLSPDSDTGEVVELKKTADAYYEQCLGLPGDQRRVKAALIRLITELTRLNMQTLHDTKSLLELQDEQVRRLAHFTRLEFPVTGDVCREQSPLAEGELVPTLLSEPPEAAKAALALFDAERIDAILDEARALIARCRDEGADTTQAEEVAAVIASFAENQTGS
ncbi:MAG TPA: hypothetical protein VK973_06880 [Arenicellales bacterium]|nr:hypothetical protein [Arenicellales bacterium]